eukprot:2114834-Rhodomonas_salina.1
MLRCERQTVDARPHKLGTTSSQTLEPRAPVNTRRYTLSTRSQTLEPGSQSLSPTYWTLNPRGLLQGAH